MRGLPSLPVWVGVMMMLHKCCHGQTMIQHRLDPGKGNILHMAGQSPSEFANYSAYLGSTVHPMGYSFYALLRHFETSDSSRHFESMNRMLGALEATRANNSVVVVPHLAIHLGYNDGNTSRTIPKSSRIPLKAGMTRPAGRPVFLRLGCEVNAPWNSHIPQNNFFEALCRMSVAQAGLHGAAVGAVPAAVGPQAADLHSARPSGLIIIMGI